jgi:hypothetical protein
VEFSKMDALQTAGKKLKTTPRKTLAHKGNPNAK